ncbi:ferritin-like domain-containing protein [Candidatus Thioglobus sp.]|uniref:ferritin-like domain-containing protein n=1 Tax=Candidatus Thioglobus sp. TaxID=2026721 RepID=UPI003D131108
MQASVMPALGQPSHFEVPQQVVSDSRVLGYLGRALSLEFSTGQHYLAQASLAKFRNEPNHAQGFVALANEEFQHANLLIDRMAGQGALPSSSVLSPATPANSIAESLQSCQIKKLALIQLYTSACQYCANASFLEDHALFSRLLEEEQAQLMRVNNWLEEFYRSMSSNQSLSRGFA